MRTAISLLSAVVVQLPGRLMTNRFTVKDRIDALAWNDATAAPAGASFTIHDRDAADSPEVGDYIGIYRAGERWAVWGAARQDVAITVWHRPSGSDLGCFATMQEALAAVPIASLHPATAGRRRYCS